MSSINALLFLFIFLRTPGQNAAEHRADQAEHQAKMNIIVEHLGADDNSYVDQEKIGDGVTEKVQRLQCSKLFKNTDNLNLI